MDMNFRLTKHFFVLSLIVLFLGACSKNYLIVDLGEDGQENNGNSNNGSSNNGSNTKDDVLVTFNASVENRHVRVPCHQWQKECKVGFVLTSPTQVIVRIPLQ